MSLLCVLCPRVPACWRVGVPECWCAVGPMIQYLPARAHVHVRAHVHLPTCMSMPTCAYMHVCPCACLLACQLVCVCACMQACDYARECMCMCALVRVCLCACWQGYVGVGMCTRDCMRGVCASAGAWCVDMCGRRAPISRFTYMMLGTSWHVIVHLHRCSSIASFSSADECRTTSKLCYLRSNRGYLGPCGGIHGRCQIVIWPHGGWSP